MTGFVPHDIPGLMVVWVAPILVGLCVGYAAGVFHFKTLQIVTDRLVAGDWTALVLQPLRFVGLAGLLFLLALWGGPALVAATAGVLVARSRMLAQARKAS